MPKEIERKYLIMENGIEYANNNLWRIIPHIDRLKKEVGLRGSLIEQGYLPISLVDKLKKETKVEIDFQVHSLRLRNKENNFYLTFKSKGLISRDEVEINISKKVFDKYWPETKGKRVKKKRYEIDFHGFNMEIDMFLDRSLIITEIEVSHMRDLKRIKPPGKDVTKNAKYQNQNLAK